MKKNKNQLMRMQNMLSGDRMSINDNFIELLTRDLDKTLKDYFDYKGLPKISITKGGGAFTVDVCFSALSIRPFSTIPDGNNLYKEM